MSDNAPQNYANHIHHDKMAYFYIALLLISFIGAAVAFFVDRPQLIVASLLINSFATLLLSTNARGYALKLQDRIVRLEMRLRLKDVLGGDSTGRIKDFTLKQLIGLRFASDAELPGLSQQVLDQNITDLNQIKQMVTEWQADNLRV